MNFDFHEQEDGFQAIRFDGQRLSLLDQRQLPAREVWLGIDSVGQAGEAIADLVVRGAPAIGITAAYAAVLAARQRGEDIAGWQADMDELEQARPTAVNLSWAVGLMRRQVNQAGRLDADGLAKLAVNIHREDIAANRRMAVLGSALIDPGSGVLTHCNTGSLATGGIGTALGVIVAGARAGRIARVFADETRPWLQGSRLTAWELARAGVHASIVVEGAAGALMASGQVQWIITGADRITARGDVANKIGTYNLAVLARHHGLRLMVVAPSTTLDSNLESGQDIAIEQRDPGEIWRAAGLESAPEGVAAWNPVFDVTPSELVDVIVTEQGVFHPPYGF